MAEEFGGFSLLSDGGDNDVGFDEDSFSLIFGDDDVESNDILIEDNQRNIETPKMSYDMDEMANKLLRLSPLGLQLSLSSDLLYSITNPNYARTMEAGTSQESRDQSKASSDFGQQPLSEKLKASNFAATFIKIGTWERKSMNQGDLVAKCYFAKRKLVWELLKKGLKSKIEIQWNDIIGIRAVMEQNQPGILQIELKQPPIFHQETDPQPRKHTIWKLASDFTGGQASICRRHFLTFPTGYLDKHYEKLLLSEPRLIELSRRPFPSMENPYFPPKLYGYRGFLLDYNHEGQDTNPGKQFNVQNFPSHLGQIQHMQPNGHIDPSSLKERYSPSSVLENQRMPCWGQGMSNYTDAVARNQGLVPSVQSTQEHPAVPFQNYNPANLGQQADMNNYTAIAPSGLGNQLLGDMQFVSYHTERVESLNRLANLYEEANPETALRETLYGQGSSGEENLVFNIGENANVIGGQFIELQPDTSMPQIQPLNPLTPQQSNNFPYGSVNNPNQSLDGFGNVNNFNNNWS